LKYAALLATRFNARLQLVHVIYQYTKVFQNRAAGAMPSFIENARISAREEMGRLRQLDFMDGVACETEVDVGGVVDEICRQSSEGNVDLVVTSTHGHTGFKHAMLGSVTEQVVRYADCPVLVVPSRSAGP
jgi:nucleotide-binding universal stress UspA family protein